MTRKFLFSGETLIQTAHRLETLAEKCVFIPMKMSLISFRILEAIAKEDIYIASDLQNLLKSKKSNIAQRVQMLEKRGFLRRERSKEDGRKIILFITPKGKKKVEDVRIRFEKARICLESFFSKEELESELKFFQKLNSFLDLQEKSLSKIFEK
ncbi:MAG: MarR family transcriptional regulator [Candidatus Moraniibacteriota bacterium]|nr:MAG: MarR family transcriptional regulator [Candidatus Moranbacteria bacterium]